MPLLNSIAYLVVLFHPATGYTVVPSGDAYLCEPLATHKLQSVYNMETERCVYVEKKGWEIPELNNWTPDQNNQAENQARV